MQDNNIKGNLFVSVDEMIKSTAELTSIPNREKETVLPKTNTVVVYKGSKGHCLHMVAKVNMKTGKRSYGFMIMYPDGNHTSMESIPRKKLLRSSNWADTFLDYDVGFTIEDIAEIIEKVRSISETLPSVVISEGITSNEVYDNLYCYCKASNLLEEINNVTIGDIPVGEMANVVSKYAVGYTKLDVLRNLKIMNQLIIDKGRQYDIWKRPTGVKAFRVNRIIFSTPPHMTEEEFV